MRGFTRHLSTIGMFSTALLAVPDIGMAASSGYVQSNLVSDGIVPAHTIDPNLLNAWGIANLPGGPFWISDNNSGKSTIYDGAGNGSSLVVTIPGPAGSPSNFVAAPTGIVANPGKGFNLPAPNNTTPASFIFSTEDGTISAWAFTSTPTQAFLIVDNSQGGTGAVYKGLALGVNARGTFLYATNFRSGHVEVYDSTFKATTLDGDFTDTNIPAGYAPFGIANIDGDLFVTYAKQNKAKHDDVAGAGHGYVDVFDTDGHLLKRFASAGALDSPWGIAQASFGFGKFGGDILIGNFGNGWINAYSTGGHYKGFVADPSGTPFAQQGLWSVTMGGATNSNPDQLYFTAGPNHEKDGVFGTLVPAGAATSGGGGGGW